MAADTFEVAVVGVGAAGLAAALAFAGDGFRTVLVGPAAARADGRTVALLDGSVRFLRAIGVWEEIEADAAPLATMRIVDDTGSLFRPPPATFQAGEIGLEAFGYNVENARLVDRLAAAARRTAGLEMIEDTVAAARFDAEASHLACAGGGEIAARLVVAADGRRSALREAAGIAARTWTYPQSALTTILAHERDHRDVSTEFHTRRGPFTLVPLPGRRSSLVWVTSPERRGGASTPRTMPPSAGPSSGRRTRSSARCGSTGRAGSCPSSASPLERLPADASPSSAKRRTCCRPSAPRGSISACATSRRCAMPPSTPVPPVATSAARTPCAARPRGRALDVGVRTGAVDGLNRTLLTAFLPADFLRGAGLLAARPDRAAATRSPCARASGRGSARRA